MPPFTISRGTAAVRYRPSPSLTITLPGNEFRVVIAVRSGLHASGALTDTLLTVQLPADELSRLIHAVEADPSGSVEIDVSDRVVRSGTAQFEFRLDEHIRQQLIHGLDPLEAVMVHHRLIADLEGRRQPPLPTTL